MSNALTINEYFASEGSRFSNKDARVIGPVLEALSNDGIVTASALVNAARPLASAIHRYFEWDDAVAAEGFRRQQAGQMLRAIHVKYTDGDGAHIARAFSVQRVENRGSRAPREFHSFKVLYGDSLVAAEMMQSAMDDLRSWRRRYEPYVGTWEKFSDTFIHVLNQIGECEAEIIAPPTVSLTDDAVGALLDWKARFTDAAEAWRASVEQMKYIIEAIKDAEDIFCKQQTNVRHRDCITCGSSFLSSHVGHRMCSKCAAHSSGLYVLSIEGAE